MKKKAAVEPEICVNVFCSFSTSCLQKQLLQDDGQNSLMKKVLDTYLLFFQISQSTATLRHVFAALRLFVQKVCQPSCKHITSKWIFQPFFLKSGFVFISFCSSPVHFSRVRQICVVVCAMRSSSAVTIDLAPPKRRQLLCCIFLWEKTLSSQRASA